jgi:NAD(P)-dependent dehydrogenase (short-subunit alcohol dehydrogenase family)
MRQMDLNYLSPLRLTRAILPHFRKKRSGHLVFISAAATVGNYPGFSHYGAAKAALEAACESMKAELAPFQIGITLVQPGPFRTNFIERSVERVRDRTGAYEATVGAFDTLLQRINGRQPGDPQKAATVIHEAIVSGSAPFRLPLGKYMIKKLRDHATARMRDIDAVVGAGLSRVFPKKQKRISNTVLTSCCFDTYYGHNKITIHHYP